MYILTADTSDTSYELDVYILGVFDDEKEAEAAALSVEKNILILAPKLQKLKKKI